MIWKNLFVREIVVVTALAAFGLAGCAPRDVEPDSPVLDVKLADLLSDDALVRETDRNAIYKAGVDAVALLREAAIEDETPEIRRLAVRKLSELSIRDEMAAGPAKEALLDIYMRNDEETVSRAAVALREHGMDILPRLAELASAMPPAEVDEPARWRHPVILMLYIDHNATIDKFVGMLGEPEYAQREATVNRMLEEITNQTFGYETDARPASRQEAIQRWREWWEVRRDRQS